MRNRLTSPLVFVLAFGAISTAVTAQSAPRDPWSVSASLTGYYVPEGTSYLQPTILGDHHALHLEARYQYEELNSASAWIGVDASGGKTVHVLFTGMLGGVFGDLKGIAPGVELTVTAGRLMYYGECEYVFDLGATSGDFFYLWTQLTWQFSRAWSGGLAAQRMRTTQTGLDLNEGLVVNWQPHDLGVALSAFNPFQSKDFYTLALTIDF